MRLLCHLAPLLIVAAVAVVADFGPVRMSSLREYEITSTGDLLFTKYINGSEYSLLWIIDSERLDVAAIDSVERYFAHKPISFHSRTLERWVNQLAYRRPSASTRKVDHAVSAVLFLRTPKARACLLDAPPLRPDYVTFEGQVANYESLVSWIEQHTGFGLESLSSTRVDSFRECRRVATPSTKREFLEMKLRGEPLVFKGGAAHHHRDAFAKWNIEYLLDVLSNVTVGVKVAPHGIFEGVEPRSKWRGHQENLASIPQVVIDQLASVEMVVVRPVHLRLLFSEFWRLAMERPFNASFYVEYFPVAAMNDLEKDVARHLPFELLEPTSRNIWIGDGKTRGKLHFDQYDNILAQLRGEKIFHVLAPNKRQQLREGHIQEAMLQFSFEQGFTRSTFADHTGMTFTAVPLSSLKDSAVTCRVKQGDMLYLPAFAWHEVQSVPGSLGLNVALNNWYPPIWDHEFPCSTCGQFFNSKKYLHIMRELSQQTHRLDENY